MKRRRHYEKPSEQASREKGEAIRRARKMARKKLIYEGLLAAPKKKLRDAAPGKSSKFVPPAIPQAV